MILIMSSSRFLVLVTGSMVWTWTVRTPKRTPKLPTIIKSPGEDKGRLEEGGELGLDKAAVTFGHMQTGHPACGQN